MQNDHICVHREEFFNLRLCSIVSDPFAHILDKSERHMKAKYEWKFLLRPFDGFVIHEMVIETDKSYKLLPLLYIPQSFLLTFINVD